MSTANPFNAGVPNSAPDLISQPPAAHGYRDWDLLLALQAALEATGEFDAVYLGELPEDLGRGAAQARDAVLSLQDWEEVDDADGDGGPQDVVRVRFLLTLIVRDGDPVARDRELDRILGACKNAINGQPLAQQADISQAIPGWTRLRRGVWMKAKAPERRMTVLGETAYFVDADDEHGTEE